MWLSFNILLLKAVHCLNIPSTYICKLLQEVGNANESSYELQPMMCCIYTHAIMMKLVEILPPLALSLGETVVWWLHQLWLDRHKLVSGQMACQKVCATISSSSWQYTHTHTCTCTGRNSVKEVVMSRWLTSGYPIAEDHVWRERGSVGQALYTAVTCWD